MLHKDKVIFVNGRSAGITIPSKPLHETTDAEWNDLFNVSLRSVLLTTRNGLEALKASGGAILNTSSLVGVISQSILAACTAPGVDVIADDSVFLTSDQARINTGHIICVSGGVEIGWRR